MGPEINDLRAAFTKWSANHVTENFLTSELIPLSKNLSNLGTTGLRALEFLTGSQPPAHEWVAQQIHALDRIDKPVAEVHLAAAPVRILLEALADKVTNK